MAKYINDERVTDEFIEDILNRCGFELVRFQPDPKLGRVVEVEPITRFEDRIMVHCRNVSMVEFMRDLTSLHPLFGLMQGVGGYSVGDEVIFLEDFMASRLTISDANSQDEKLFDEYYDAMASMFGKEYEDDATNYYKKFIEESQAESGEIQKQ